MIEISFYNSTNKKWFADFAASFSTATGKDISVNGSKLVVPPSLANGRYEFYELNEGLALVVIDCIFYEEVSFRKMIVEGNDNYLLMFNAGDHPLPITLDNGSVIHLGETVADAVVFSSHRTGSLTTVPANQHIKVIQIIFHRDWCVKLFLDRQMLLRSGELRQIANCEPIQFVTHFDLRSRPLVNEIMSLPLSRLNVSDNLEGYVCRLLAFFFNNMVARATRKAGYESTELLRVTQLKEQIENNLDEMPTVAEAAASCLMSESKFAALFKELFQLNYGEFFHCVKMQKAKALLETGHSVTSAGHSIGYHNIGHFVKIFKKHFNVTPGVYLRRYVNQH